MIECKVKPESNVYQRVMQMRADTRLDVNKDIEADVSKFKYEYYSAEILSELSRKVLPDYGLLMWPALRDIEYVKESTTLCKATVELELINVDKPEEKLSLTGYGIGSDNMAAAKALTYANRRAMMYIFGLGSSEDDPERPQSRSDKTKDAIANLRENAAKNNQVTPPTPSKMKTETAASAPVNITSAEPIKTEAVKPTAPATPAAPAKPTPTKPAAPATPTTPVKQTLDDPIAGRKAQLRKHAVDLFADGRLAEPMAREADRMMRNAKTAEDCSKIAQFLSDNDAEKEAV